MIVFVCVVGLGMQLVAMNQPQTQIFALLGQFIQQALNQGASMGDISSAMQAHVVGLSEQMSAAAKKAAESVIAVPEPIPNGRLRIAE